MVKNIQFYILLLFSVLSVPSIQAQDTVGKNTIYNRILPSPVDGGFKMDGYWVWCGSVIKGEDNRYHMFASRWPKIYPFHPGWMVASEIVRASADDPKGPYVFEEVVLPARGPQFWDGRATHNPSITKYGDTYVLFYMGSTHPFANPIAEQLNLNSPEATVARSNKRIGIATSKSVFGPWERRDKPIIDTKPNTFFSFLTSNPAPLIRKDGSVMVVFKGRGHGNKFPYQTRQSLGIAAAKSINDKFYVLNQDQPILNSNTIGEVEDPFLWEDSTGLHLLVKDMSHNITGEHHAGALLHSSDGIQWHVDKNPKAYSRVVLWDDGVTRRMGQMERPFILMDEGRPAYMFFATMDGEGGFEKGTKSWNMVIPLKKNK